MNECNKNKRKSKRKMGKESYSKTITEFFFKRKKEKEFRKETKEI